MKEQVEMHYQILKDASSNECVSGHVYFMPEWVNMFDKLNMKQIFLIRDFRDILVSYVYFVRTFPDQSFSFANPDISIKETMLILINGIPEVGYPNFTDYIRCFLGWMKQSNVLSVRFEDLIISEQSRIKTLQKMVEFLWTGLIPPVPLDQMIKRMENSINPNESPTFREGKIGGWRHEFDEEIKEAFKDVAGD
jgi:hypothetical protein